MKKIWLFAIVCVIGAYAHWDNRSIARAPGILAPDPPRQTAMSGAIPVFAKNGYNIKPLAGFAVQARVILKASYHLGREADLSPVDLALGWGRMSDTEILKSFEFSQSGRFYYWKTATFPIPREEIQSHSANMHIIPATTAVEKRLEEIRPGHIVKFRGYLAEARAEDGWRWRSSLTRNDTGAGACELIWVESLDLY